MKLKGIKVVITGGASGLGLALAKLFIFNESKVVILGRNEHNLQEVRDELSSKLLSTELCDVRNYDLLESLATKHRDTSILINNAGVWVEGDTELLTQNQINTVIDINFKSVIYVTKAFLPVLKLKKQSFIVNIISSSGIKARAGEALYDATKFAVHGFTEAIRQDLATTGIRVIGVYPGGMNTQFFSKAGAVKDTSWWMKPEQIARIIVNSVEQDENIVIDHIEINKRKI